MPPSFRSRRRRLRSLLGTVLVIGLTLSGLLVIVLQLRSNAPSQLRPVLVLSGDWAPYSGPELTNGGPVVEFMTDVLTSAGFDPSVSFTTWDSAEHLTENQSAFGAFPLVGSAERRERFLLSESLLTFDYVLFVRSEDSEDISKATDLAERRVGGISGYDYWPEFEQAAGEIERFPSTEAGLLALAHGEIDVLAEGESSGQAILAEPTFPVDASSIHPLTHDSSWARSTQDLYFMMPDRPEFAAALESINAAIADAQSSPDYAEFVAELSQERRDRVALTGTKLIALYSEQGELIGYSPAGAEGLVTGWPSSLERSPDDSPRVRVKLGGGPFAGRIVWVEPENLRITQ